MIWIRTLILIWIDIWIDRASIDDKSANQDLPSSEKVKILEPVKPVVTRWNSFCSAFERAVQLQGAFNSYINYHVADQRRLDDYARAHNNKMPTVPR